MNGLCRVPDLWNEGRIHVIVGLGFFIPELRIMVARYADKPE